MGIKELLQAIVDLVKDGPGYLRVVVVAFLLAVLGLIVWRTLLPPDRSFETAFTEASKSLNPSLGVAGIQLRIEDLMRLARTDDQRCRVGFLYLDVAAGLASPTMPLGLQDFIETGSTRHLECIARLANEAKRFQTVVAASKPTPAPGASPTPTPHGSPNPTTAPVLAAERVTHTTGATQILAATTTVGSDGWMYLGKRVSPGSAQLTATRTIVESDVPVPGGVVTAAVNVNLRKTNDPRSGIGSIAGLIAKGSSVTVTGTPVDLPVPASGGSPASTAVWAPIRVKEKAAPAAVDVATAAAATAAPTRAVPAVAGIDVSAFQDPIDWPAAAGSGIGFAIIKATEGTTSTNQNYATDSAGAKSAGLVRGAYHMLRFNGDPEAQARYYLETAKLQPGDLPPILDLELADATQTPAANVAKALSFLTVVQNATRSRPIVYAAYAQYTQNLRGSSALAAYPLWIASYGEAAPTLPDGWTTWTFWQYSDKGSVPGGKTYVNVDRFNGTPEQLRSLTIPAR